MYRPITAMEVTAAYAVAFQRYGSPRTKAPPAASQMALVGVRVRGLMWCQKDEAGSAPSREKAEIIRDVSVADAMPQSSWAPMAMSSRSLPPVSPTASMKIWAGGTPVGVSIALE